METLEVTWEVLQGLYRMEWAHALLVVGPGDWGDGGVSRYRELSEEARAVECLWAAGVWLDQMRLRRASSLAVGDE